jgi:anti-sigma B factor antagonist
MAFRVTPRLVGEIVIVDASGKLALGDGTARLRQTLRGLFDEGHNRIIVNLAEVDYVDSSGIGELVTALTTARRGGGEVKLLQVAHGVRDVLLATKLYTVFDVHSDEAVAVSSFT